MKAKQVLYLGLILPVLFLSACSSTPSKSETRTPSKSEAREALVSKLNEEEKEREKSIKLVSFEKIYEQSGKKSGIKTYKTKFEAKLAFPEGWDGVVPGEVQPGGRKTIKGNLSSEKTSEGWKKWRVKSDFLDGHWQ